MEHASSHRSRIYTPRTGVGIEEVVGQLEQPPVHEGLSEREKEELARFGADLIEGKYGQQEVASSKSLEEIYAWSVLSEQQSYWLDYFTANPAIFEQIKGYLPADTEAGQEAMVETILSDRQTLSLDETHGSNEVAAKLSEVESIKNRIGSADRKKIASRSSKFKRAALAYCVVEGKNLEDLGLSSDESFSVHYQPENLVAKTEDLAAYRSFLSSVLRDLPAEAETTNTFEAVRRLLAKQTLARVNEMTLSLYNSSLYLIDQAQRSEDESTLAPLVNRLKKVLPVAKRIQGGEIEDEPRKRFITRMDYLRNGAVLVEGDDGGETVSVISAELRDFIRNLESNSTQLEMGDTVLPPETIRQLEHTYWGPEELKEFNEQVLSKWGLLSEVSSTWEEAEKRDGWAKDGKIQVVITPKKDALSYSSVRGVLKVPESYSCNLIDVWPAGALPASAHELTHALQSIYDKMIGENVPLAKIKGKHHLAMKENGGLAQEQAMQSQYFGRIRPYNLHYYRALKVKLSGGSLVNAAEAFYDSYRAGSSDVDLRTAAYTAADRTLRLYRKGGENSQPLDYLESGLITQALSNIPTQKRNEIVMATASFDLADAVKLMELGLIALPELDFDPVADVMDVYFERWHQEE